MTEARMDWGRMRITVEGHANAAKAGEDIVCAGISMMVNALAGALEEAQERGRTTFTYERDDRAGRARIQANPKMGSMAEIKAYFRMCVKGLKMVQAEYPKYIRVREEIGNGGI